MNRILVVDDEPSILQGLALGLSSKDNVVDLANAGNAALNKGSQEKYDVLIVDLCLPDMHGFDVIRKLKEMNPQIISIVITAQSSRESVVEARAWGVIDYFEKPFHIHSIREAIARGITRRALGAPCLSEAETACVGSAWDDAHRVDSRACATGTEK